VANYRESYGLFACLGILFNHESPLRPHRFVSRKITAAVARIGAGSRERLTLGISRFAAIGAGPPITSRRCGRCFQHDEPGDFVVATGVAHSLEEFVAAAFAQVGLDWRDRVDYDASLARPSDIRVLARRSYKGGTSIGWRPTVSFAEIVARMMRAEREGSGST